MIISEFVAHLYDLDVTPDEQSIQSQKYNECYHYSNY